MKKHPASRWPLLAALLVTLPATLHSQLYSPTPGYQFQQQFPGQFQPTNHPPPPYDTRQPARNPQYDPHYDPRFGHPHPQQPHPQPQYPFQPQFPYNQPKTPVDRLRYEHSDSRCLDDLLTYNPEEFVTVTTRYGKVTGRYSYLCDMPGVAERDRPSPTWGDRPFEHGAYPLHQGYRIRPRVRGNVTMFLGVPYAKPPTRENNLRFKVNDCVTVIVS